MMAKKLPKTCALLVAGSMLLSGCGPIADSGVAASDYPAVAEYIAKQMLKYDNSYSPDLLDTIRISPAEETQIVRDTTTSENTASEGVANPEASNTNTSNTNAGASGTNPESTANSSAQTSSSEASGTSAETENVSRAAVTTGTPPDADISLPQAEKISDLYNVKGFDVVYGGATVHSSYPEDDTYFSLTPDDGRKLYVISFTITNNSGKKAKFSQNNNVLYELTFDDQSFYRPSMTLLDNDMQFIEKSIGAKKSVNGVLVFSVPENVDRSGAKLFMSGNGYNYILTVVK